MYSSQFEGFSSSQATQSFDSSQSPAKSRDAHGLVPVTVKQISQASDSADGKSSFLINGVDVTNVTLVGMVFDKVEMVTDVSFILDDGTGRMNCKRWINDAFDTKEMEKIQDGMYVRVIGTMKNFQTIKQLGAFSVKPVTKFDEVTFHFIDCIHSHVLSTKSQAHMGNSSLSTPVRNGLSDYQTVSSSQISEQRIVDGFKGCDQLVLEYLQQPSICALEIGASTDDISQKLKVPMGKIKESIKSLEEEGLIYSTIDDSHYRSASS